MTIENDNQTLVTLLPGEDYVYKGGALTLPSNLLGTPTDAGVEITKDQDSGWTITGVIHEDYYSWINDFYATHPKHGVVAGNFERKIYATDLDAFNAFISVHPPYEWDYGDI